MSAYAGSIGSCSLLTDNLGAGFCFFGGLLLPFFESLLAAVSSVFALLLGRARLNEAVTGHIGVSVFFKSASLSSTGPCPHLSLIVSAVIYRGGAEQPSIYN